MKKFTIKDIARLANVSTATVSRVINNYPFIHKKTRKKVQDIILQVDYQPNATARSLATNKSRMIGVIVWDLGSLFFSEIVQKIGKECRKRGYQPIFCSTEGRDEIQEEYINLLRQENIEGFLIATANLSDPQIEKLVLQDSPPVVLIDRTLQTELASSVTVDNEQGAYLAIQHLIEHGHRRIACVTGPENSSSGLGRIQGYQKALLEKKIPIDRQLIIPGNFLRESGYHAAKKIISLKAEKPTAIFCSNDCMALGIMEFFSNQGIRIPQDFSLIGFDDISIASFSFIQLTTIDSRKIEVVRTAIDLLFQKIADPNNKRVYRKKLLPKLVIRKTCGCP